MNINVNAEENSECVALMPIEVFRQDIDAKRKIAKILKRVIDIVAAMCGLLIMAPITVGIFIAKKIVKDDRTNIL